MKHFENTWISADHLEIFSQAWEPDAGVSKGVVCLVHGLGEHSGRYVHLAERLTQTGFSITSFDLRGHGKSAGQRGHVDSSKEFLVEIDHLLQNTRERHPEKPCFLYGHSLGGLLVLFYALKRRPELTGLVVSSPGLRSSLEEQTLKVAFTKALAPVCPKLSISTGLRPELLSRDPEVVNTYCADGLVHDKASLQLAKTMLEMISFDLQHAQELKLPLLIMHGTADQIVFPTGSSEFASKVNCDCTLKFWDGYFHETHNDPGNEEVIDTVIRWMESRI